jgi:hypothetical protein
MLTARLAAEAPALPRLSSVMWHDPLVAAATREREQADDVSACLPNQAIKRNGMPINHPHHRKSSQIRVS